MHKLFAHDVIEIKRLADNGERYRELMERFHQPWAVIHAIATGQIPVPQPKEIPCSH